MTDDMCCFSLDLQDPAGDDRSGTVAWWERYLARVRGVVSDLRTRPGDWADDLALLKTFEQEAVDTIQRLTSRHTGKHQVTHLMSRVSHPITRTRPRHCIDHRDVIGQRLTTLLGGVLTRLGINTFLLNLSRS